MTIDLSDLATELEEAVLPNGTPSPYTSEHAEAAAHTLGYDSAAQRDEVDPPKKRKRRTKAEMEAARAAEGKAGPVADAPSVPEGEGLVTSPFTDDKEPTLEPTPFDDMEVSANPVDDVPDVTDTMVLVDEIHFLRTDLRDLAAEVRKMALAFDKATEGKARAA